MYSGDEWYGDEVTSGVEDNDYDVTESEASQ